MLGLKLNDVSIKGPCCFSLMTINSPLDNHNWKKMFDVKPGEPQLLSLFLDIIWQPLFNRTEQNRIE